METEITYPMSIKLTKWNENYFAQSAFLLQRDSVELNVVVAGVLGVDVN